MTPSRLSTLAMSAAAAALICGSATAKPPGLRGAPSQSAPAQGSASGGTGGGAAAGDTAASSLGVGATTSGPDGTASALGTGGGAVAGEGGHINNHSKVHQTGHGLMGNTKAQAMDHGTFSKSRTKTRVIDGEGVTGTTRTMSHVPGSKPVKSTTSIGAAIPPG